MTTLSPLTRGMLWAMLGAKILGAWGLRWDIQWHLRIGRVLLALALVAAARVTGVRGAPLGVAVAAALGGAAGGTRLARVVEP